MDIKIERPLVFFDLETTGLSVSEDRICQLSITKIMPQTKHGKGEDPIVRTRLINPGKFIPEDATAIHGISNEDVADEPTFEQFAKDLYEAFFKGADIGGHNILKFDIPMLREHFLRCNIDWPNQDTRFVDTYSIASKVFPKKLELLYEFFTGNKAEDAHDAEYDNMMSIEVLSAMVKNPRNYQVNPAMKLEYPETVEELHELSIPTEEYVDYARKIIINPSTGDYEFNFGKHKGKKITSQRNYCKWILAQPDFTEDTKRAILNIFQVLKPDEL